MLASLVYLALASAVAAAPISPSRRGNSLLDVTGAHATVYYDLTDSLCSAPGDPFPANWAVTSGINGGIPKCEQWAHANAKSLAGLGTNQIVAIDASLLAANPDEWCGKEVVIYDADGKQFQFSEGPLFVWDGCAACMTQPIVDLSAKAFVELKGGSCAGNNPGGLSFQVLNTNIWDPILQDGTGGGPASGGGSGESTPSPPSPPASSTTATSTSTSAQPTTTRSTSAQPLTTRASTSLAPSPIASVSLNLIGGINQGAVVPPPATSTSAGPMNSTQTTGSSGGCIYGAWACHGNKIEVCNYVTTTSLDWVTVGNCPSKCEITSTGSVDCQ